MCFVFKHPPLRLYKTGGVESLPRCRFDISLQTDNKMRLISPNKEGKYDFAGIERELPKVRYKRKGSTSSSQTKEDTRLRSPVQQTGARRPQDSPTARPIFGAFDQLAVTKTEFFIDSMKSLPNCLECQKPVYEDEGYQIPALNGYFHDNCFQCNTCHQEFSDDRPYVAHQGKAYCERDYKKILKSTQMCAHWYFL